MNILNVGSNRSGGGVPSTLEAVSELVDGVGHEELVGVLRPGSSVVPTVRKS